MQELRCGGGGFGGEGLGFEDDGFGFEGGVGVVGGFGLGFADFELYFLRWVLVGQVYCGGGECDMLGSPWPFPSSALRWSPWLVTPSSYLIARPQMRNAQGSSTCEVVRSFPILLGIWGRHSRTHSERTSSCSACPPATRVP